VLTIALIWTALHTASHMVVANHSATTGPAEAAVLAASTLMLALLVRVAASDQASTTEDTAGQPASPTAPDRG